MKIFVASVTATTEFEGRKVTVRRGVTMVNEDDSFLENREELFRPLEVPYIGDSTTEPEEPATPAQQGKPVTPAPAKPVATKPVAKTTAPASKR